MVKLLFVFIVVLGVLSSSTQARVCKAETNWGLISSNLATSSFILPTVPSPSGTVTPSVAPHDTSDIYVKPLATGVTFNKAQCNADNAGWDSDLVSFGPIEKGFCRVSPDASSGALMLNNRPELNSNTLVSSQPNWISARFPIPSGQRLVNVWMNLGYARLFGGTMTECADNEKVGGVCTPYVNTTTWLPGVKSGFYLLWGNPADATSCGSGGAGWIVTGPYLNNTLTYGATVYNFEVPDALQNSGASEIVLTAFVYNQYPGGCVKNTCVSGRYTYQSLWISQFQGHTWSHPSIMFPREPPTNHPRLYSPAQNSLDWTPYAQIKAMPCSTLALTWGGVANIRSIFSLIADGWDSCTSQKPTDISKLSFLVDVMKPTPVCASYMKNPVQFFFMRKQKECYGFFGAGTGNPNANCDWTLAQITSVQNNMITCEMAAIPSVKWNEGYALGFDLGTTPPMRYYSHFLDVFWYDLTEAQRNQVLTAMDPAIDGFIATQSEKHWALYNGNNWTPILSFGAIHWAVLRWHDDPRAQIVAGIILDTMWINSPFFEDDGVYRESMSYAKYALQAVYNLQYMLMKGFGRNLNSHRWINMPNFAKWYMANMLGDGRLTDLADSHNDQGNPVEVLHSLYYDKLLNMSAPFAPPAAPAVDPCDLWRFFSNNYYQFILIDPWMAYPGLVQNWAALTTCTTPPEYTGTVTTTTKLFGESGWGIFKHFRSGATQQGGLSNVPVNRFTQVNTVTLTASAIPNFWPHVHSDFSTFIWTVYGARLLVDFGYGRIAGPNDKYTMLERTPLAHNVLNIPEAVDTTGKGNTAHIVGTRGKIEKITTNGGYNCFLLDGSYVYGRNGTVDPNNHYGPSADSARYGWLNDYKRWMCDIAPSGTTSDYIILESFKVREDRPAISAENHFHTIPPPKFQPPPNICNISFTGTYSSLIDTKTLSIAAVCSNIFAGMVAESAGTLRGHALRPGGFVADPTPISDTVDEFMRYRWVPTQKVRSDVRGWALRSGISAANVPSSNVIVGPCAQQIPGYPPNGKICVRFDISGIIWAVFSAPCGASCTDDTFYDLEDVSIITPSGISFTTSTGKVATTTVAAATTTTVAATTAKPSTTSTTAAAASSTTAAAATTAKPSTTSTSAAAVSSTTAAAATTAKPATTSSTAAATTTATATTATSAATGKTTTTTTATVSGKASSTTTTTAAGTPKPSDATGTPNSSTGSPATTDGAASTTDDDVAAASSVSVCLWLVLFITVFLFM